jgi:Flp pilus assembly protein TadD
MYSPAVHLGVEADIAARSVVFWGAVAVMAALSACSGTGSPPQAGHSALMVGRGQAVDGLTVGHRLMAAGEHELALKAYLRAAADRGGVDVDILSALGSANLKLGRLGQAEQLLRRALEQDAAFVPALNNLGVVLMEKGETGEARRVFEQAFAQDSGKSDSIRENLRLAIALTDQNRYAEINEKQGFSLVRRGRGDYLLLSD